MNFLPQEFSDFLDLNCNRPDFIQQYLLDHGVHTHRIVLDGKSHVLVQFDPICYNPMFKIKTVIAHHDRVEGTPGANDNSAAVWMLMNWAIELSKWRDYHNVRIFFTDGEELGWNNGISDLGSYKLANTFKRLGIDNDDVYVFDSCGRGDIAVLSQHEFPEHTNGVFMRKYYDLYERTQDILRRACPAKWMSLPIPYSDNASFIACGIPAVAITMLPAREASDYAKNLISNRKLRDQVRNNDSTRQERIRHGDFGFAYKNDLPQTWKLFHTKNDSLESLTQDSFRIMENILLYLAQAKTLAY